MKIHDGKIKPDSVDLYYTLSTYNFHYWFDGEKGIVILDENAPIIAMVSIDGHYEIYSASIDTSIGLIEKMKWTLGIGEDVSGFYRLARSDPLLSLFASRYRGWRLRSTSLWWSLVIGVCQQNASFRQGWGMLYDIVRLYNRRVLIGDKPVLLPPKPTDILEKPELLLKARTGYRWKTIVNIAEAINNGVINPDEYQGLNPERIEEELTRIKGVGKYTARLAILLAYRKYSLPPIDRWLKRIIMEVYHVDSEHAEKEWVKRWKEWSGLAALAVTITLDAEPISKALERIKKKQLLPIKTNKPTPINLWKTSRQWTT